MYRVIAIIALLISSCYSANDISREFNLASGIDVSSLALWRGLDGVSVTAYTDGLYYKEVCSLQVNYYDCYVCEGTNDQVYEALNDVVNLYMREEFMHILEPAPGQSDMFIVKGDEDNEMTWMLTPERAPDAWTRIDEVLMNDEFYLDCEATHLEMPTRTRQFILGF